MDHAKNYGGFAQSSAYSYRAPSPPHITVPPSTRSDHVIELPIYNGVAGQDLTTGDLRIITQGNHTAVDNTVAWEYGWRRSSQKILPFLYLGPASAAKDKEFLQDSGITMLLGVRDAVTAKAGLMNGAKMAKELAIEADSIDTEGLQALIRAFPIATKKINNHLLSVYRQQGNSTSVQQSLIIDPSSFHTGRVLVYCESGNERSAAVVAAYLMAIYGLDMVKAIQFITSQRFCVAFDEPLKKILLSYQDVLEAQRNVAAANRGMNVTLPLNAYSGNHQNAERNKRGFSTSEEEELQGYTEDQERFVGRAPWAPFTDHSQ